MPKKKTSKKRTKKLESLSQTDGMSMDNAEQKFEPTTLDQVFGDDGTSKYKTLDLGVYEQVLDNMSKADLKGEAIRVGLLPIDNVEQLRNRLVREFTSHASKYKKPVQLRDPKDIPPEIQKILSEGK